jgi:hypothetical protein
VTPRICTDGDDLRLAELRYLSACEVVEACARARHEGVAVARKYIAARRAMREVRMPEMDLKRNRGSTCCGKPMRAVSDRGYPEWVCDNCGERRIRTKYKFVKQEGMKRDETNQQRQRNGMDCEHRADHRLARHG